MVLTTKHLLGKAKDPYLALLVYRNTLRLSGHSQAEDLMERQLQMAVPKHEEVAVPQWPPQTWS